MQLTTQYNYKTEQTVIHVVTEMSIKDINKIKE